MYDLSLFWIRSECVQASTVCAKASVIAYSQKALGLLISVSERVSR